MTNLELADQIESAAAIRLVGRDLGQLPVGASKLIVAALRAAARPAPVAWRWKPQGATNWILAFDEPRHPSAEPLYPLTAENGR